MNDILPKEFPELKESIYAGFSLRLSALIIDLLIWLPIIVASYYIRKLDRSNIIYTTLFTYSFSIIYNIVLVNIFEGTPGKRITKIKIRRKNGKRISIKHAILRECVTFLLSGCMSIAYILTVLKTTDSSFTYQHFQELRPTWYYPFDWIYNIWIYSEVIVILLNKRKRALHDFVAGTVVIKDKFENIAEHGA